MGDEISLLSTWLGQVEGKENLPLLHSASLNRERVKGNPLLLLLIDG